MSSSPGCLGLLLAPWKVFAPDPPPRDLGIPPSADPREVDRLLKAFTPPARSDDPFSLTWMARGADGGPGNMVVWVPRSRAERAEAERFYRAAHWQSWADVPQLRALLAAGRGPWLVRVQAVPGEFSFVTLLEEDDPDPYRAANHGMTSDPADAARLTADAAERVALEWVRDMGCSPGDISWPEPVPASRPWRDGRFACLARD